MIFLYNYLSLFWLYIRMDEFAAFPLPCIQTGWIYHPENNKRKFTVKAFMD